MIILWDNKAETAALSVISENPNYPKENLQDTRLAKRYRTLVDSSQRIVFGAAAANITATYAVVLGHNISDSATINIEGNATDSWGSPTFSQAMTKQGDVYIAEFTSAAFDFWSIEIDDPTNPDNYIEVGFVFIGISLQMPAMAPTQEMPYNTASSNSVSNSGQLYGNEKYNFKSFKITSPHVTNALRNSIITMFDTIKNIKPFILIIWSDDLAFESPIYCFYTDKSLKWKKTGATNFPFSISFKFQEVF